MQRVTRRSLRYNVQCGVRVHLVRPSIRTFAGRRDDGEPSSGTATPGSEKDESNSSSTKHRSPFYFIAGYALFAKRPSRPFPPPFLSQPSHSFSDPLSTHNRSVDKRQYFDGEVIRGITNGDDAVLVSDTLIAANDGVGAWAQKERGHAALWSRLILHFWALEDERATESQSDSDNTEPDPKQYLQRAYELTKEATSTPSEWFGTTTASGALVHHNASSSKPLLFITQLGDSQILVIRPKKEPDSADAEEKKVQENTGSGEVIFKTEEQWHWFDCPRQLGTNSPDTPDGMAILDKVEVEEEDVVLAMSDGVSDNLWQHEVVENVVASMRKAKLGERNGKAALAEGMQFVAAELVKAARVVATDPFAESPFMERAVEEGLPIEGGKLDDISVVAAVCRRRPD